MISSVPEASDEVAFLIQPALSDCYDLAAGSLHEDVAQNGAVDAKTHQRA